MRCGVWCSGKHTGKAAGRAPRPLCLAPLMASSHRGQFPRGPPGSTPAATGTGQDSTGQGRAKQPVSLDGGTPVRGCWGVPACAGPLPCAEWVGWLLGLLWMSVTRWADLWVPEARTFTRASAAAGRPRSLQDGGGSFEHPDHSAVSPPCLASRVALPLWPALRGAPSLRACLVEVVRLAC